MSSPPTSPGLHVPVYLITVKCKVIIVSCFFYFLCKESFTLNLPSAAKHGANIRNLSHKAQDTTMKSAVFIENALIKEETKNDVGKGIFPTFRQHLAQTSTTNRLNPTNIHNNMQQKANIK